MTPWTVAPLSMGFYRQEYWSGLPCPSPGKPPDPGTEPTFLMSLALQMVLFQRHWKASISYFSDPEIRSKMKRTGSLLTLSKYQGVRKQPFLTSLPGSYPFLINIMFLLSKNVQQYISQSIKDSAEHESFVYFPFLSLLRGNLFFRN